MKQPTAIIVQLVHIHGPMKGEIQEFSGNEITIGRHTSCNLQFPRDIVVISRNHASIIREGNRFKIVDHSTNGTFVNGERITEAYLKNGDVILFTQGGPKVSFLTRIDENAAANDKKPDALVNPVHDTGYGTEQTPSHSTPVTPSIPAAPPRVEPIPRSKPIPRTAEPIHRAEPIPRQAHEPAYQPAQHVPQPGQIKVEVVKAPLIVQYGPVLQSFNELPVTIGTQADCDLKLEHPALLERHIQIFFSSGSYRVKDLTGRNQVMINGQPIVSPAALMPGDKLFLTATGPAFQFIEGGRMAEINIPNQETPGNVEKISHQKEERPAEKKTGSLFKKFFS